MEGFVPLAVALLISFGGWVLLRIKKRRAESWPMVPGRFEQGEVRGRDTGYVADMSYSYSVNGSYYAGFYRRTFRMERFADQFIDSLKAQAVLVRYHPEDPENSVIREQDNLGLFSLQ